MQYTCTVNINSPKIIAYTYITHECSIEHHGFDLNLRTEEPAARGCVHTTCCINVSRSGSIEIATCLESGEVARGRAASHSLTLTPVLA